MKILFLTNRLPFPLTSGYLRQYYFIRELSRCHRVTLLSRVPPNCPEAHIQAMARVTDRVITFPSAEPSRSVWRNAANRIATRLWKDSAMASLCAAAGQLVQQESFDAAVLHGLSTAAALEHLSGIRVVADLCDANSRRFLAAARHGGLARLPLAMWDYVRARRLELRFIHSGAQLIFATERDRQALLGDAPRRASVVPNGVDLDYWRRSSDRRGLNTIVFTGAMNYPPNADAAVHFIDRILPRVREQAPNVNVVFAGRSPPRGLIRAGRAAGVTLTGFVDDIRPYLEQATVFAAPLRYCSGIQNKILQSLAMQVPVVATPAAAEGLHGADGTPPPVDIAGDQTQFAERLSQHLADGTVDRAPCAAARLFVEQHFQWSHSGQLLEQLICSPYGVPD